MLIYIWLTEWYQQYIPYRSEWYDDQWKIIWREWAWIGHPMLLWRQYSSTSLDGLTEHLSGATDGNSSYLSEQLTSRYELRTLLHMESKGYIHDCNVHKKALHIAYYLHGVWLLLVWLVGNTATVRDCAIGRILAKGVSPRPVHGASVIDCCI